MPQPPFRPRRLAPLGLLVVAGLATSCRDAVAPPPESLAIAQNTAPSYSATFGLANATSPANAMALQAFPEARAVTITISGYITGVVLPDATYNRRMGPAGWNCYGSVMVNYSATGNVGPVCNSGSFETPETWESLPTVIQGNGTLTRGGGWSATCPGDPMSQCWSFEGSQNVTIKVLDLKGVMKSSKSAITAPGNVNFWWEGEPGTPRRTPYQTFEWWWVPQGGSAVYYAPWNGQGSIWHWVTTSGTMYARVKINGVEQIIERYVHFGPPTLSLSHAPSEVYAGDSVHFTARVLPDSTGTTSLRWFWFPEQPIIGLRSAQAPPLTMRASVQSLETQQLDSVEVQHCAQQRTCSFLPTWHGAMKVHAIVAGTYVEDAEQITLLRDSLQVTADPTNPKAGERVVFKVEAKSKKSVTTKRWTWKADSGRFSADSVCEAGSGKTECRYDVYVSGWMLVRGTIKDRPSEFLDSVRATAVPCPPSGDSLIDRLELIKAWKEAFTASNPNGSLMSRREKGGYMYRDNAGDWHYVDEPAGPSQTPCTFPRANPVYTDPAGKSVRFKFHTHPFRINELVYGCPSLPGEPKYAQHPGDPNGTTAKATVGVSERDLREAQQQNKEYVGYILDKHGNVWRYNDPWYDPYSSKPIKQWKRDKESACFTAAN